jgi:hypothetical protein
VNQLENETTAAPRGLTGNGGIYVFVFGVGFSEDEMALIPASIPPRPARTFLTAAHTQLP